MDKNISMQDLEVLLKMNIKSNIYKSSDNMSDCVEFEFGYNEQSEIYEKTIIREQHILNLLGHIALNPSDIENKRLLKNIYVYDKTDHKSRDIPLNCSSSEAKYFLSELVNSAKMEAKLRKNIGKLSENKIRKVYIIHGLRGVGKTIFLNHIFSEYNDYLDKEKCIWVRINMVDMFGDTKPNIQEWLLSKLSLVVYRYFSKQSIIAKTIISDEKNIDIHDTLTDYVLKRKDEATRVKWHEQLRIMKRIFQTEKLIKLKRGIVPFELGLEMSRILVEKNYCFLFIVDGLDRLDLSPRYMEKFDHVLLELNHLVHTDTSLGGAILVICRTESVPVVKDRLIQKRTRERNVFFKVRKVSYLPFSDIIKERFEYIKRDVKAKSKAKKWTITDWPQHFNQFIQYLFTEYEVSNVAEFSDKLYSIFTHNNRSKIQICQLTYLDYLRNTKYKKQYELIERMCKGGLKFPVAPYYSTDKNGIIIFSTERIYDNIFLPLVFNYPYNNNYIYENKGHAETFILTGLRILQFINVLREMNKSNKFRYISCNLLQDFLSTVFYYDKGVISSLLLLFSDYELIELNGIPFTHNEVRNYNLIGMPKIDYVLSLIRNVAYLNMCAMRTPVDKKLIIESGIIRAACLSLCNIDYWSSIKIINAINMVRILKMVNSIEGQSILKLIENNQIKDEYIDILNFANSNFNIFEIYSEEDEKILIRQLNGIFQRIGDIRDLLDLTNRSYNC